MNECSRQVCDCMEVEEKEKRMLTMGDFGPCKVG
jgi:hypothetical protein